MSHVEKLIDNVEVEVGGQVIDKQYGHWMKLWTDLTHITDKADLLEKCSIKTAAAGEKSMVPLQFWFCRNPGLALPLIALQYHEVKLNVTFADTGSKIFSVKYGVITYSLTPMNADALLKYLTNTLLNKYNSPTDLTQEPAVQRLAAAGK